MLKLFFLFIAIWFTIINGVRVYYKNPVNGRNTFAQAVGIAGFVYMQFLM